MSEFAESVAYPERVQSQGVKAGRSATRALWVFGVASVIAIAALATRIPLLITMAAVLVIGLGWTGIRLVWVDLNETRWDLEDADADYDELLAEHEQLQTDAAVKDIAIANHDEALAAVQADLDAAQRSRAEVEASLAMAVDHAAGLEAQLGDARAQLSRSEVVISDLTARLAAAETAVAAAERKLAESLVVAPGKPAARENTPLSAPAAPSTVARGSHAAEPALSRDATSTESIRDEGVEPAAKHAAVAAAFEVPDWDDPTWDTLDADPATILLSWEAHIRRSGFKVVG